MLQISLEHLDFLDNVLQSIHVKVTDTFKGLMYLKNYLFINLEYYFVK